MTREGVSMRITLRTFEEKDIPDKVRWINDPLNNRYLHYDLPLEEEKTRAWFAKNKGREDRWDAVIEADGEPCGLIGLLGIDRKNRKAEYYIAMGEQARKGQGVATKATWLLLERAFGEMELNRVYLFTEAGNTAAQKLFEKAGFAREGLLKDDLYSRGQYVDRVAYGMTKEQFGRAARALPESPVQKLGEMNGNTLYVKREDMIPCSFGGNKARKAMLFFEEIDAGDYDTVVTYGSSSSNHCRVVANMAAARGMGCTIISPEEASEPTFNSKMMAMFGAVIVTVPVNEVHDTIEAVLEKLRKEGKKPFFIAGGGHGDTGTQAFRDCYDEIVRYEQKAHVRFDRIFLASGTGTTQAGLICGSLLKKDDRKIIGISIARKNPRGRDVILDSVRSYMNAKGHPPEEEALQKATVFVDAYTGDGYAKGDERITEVIGRVFCKYGIPLDETYTGKAFAGMEETLKKEGVQGENILFIHTGGTPLFFDHLMKEGQ